MAQEIDNLTSGNLLGIEEIVDAHIDKYLLAVRLEILVAIDTRNRFLRTELLCHNCREDIVVLDRVYRDKEVALTNSRLTQHRELCSVALDSNHIYKVTRLGQRLRVYIGYSNIVTITTEHTSKVCTHISSTSYHYLHNTIK